jgi:hypothetical protein
LRSFASGNRRFRCGRKAIARHDIEADVGQESHPSRLGFGVTRRQRLEDLNFPGDVEVVNAIAETRISNRPRRGAERARGAKQHRNVLDCSINAGGLAKIKRAGRETKGICDGFDFVEIPSCQDGACAPANRRLRDQLAGVAGRPVDQDGSAQ